LQNIFAAIDVGYGQQYILKTILYIVDLTMFEISAKFHPIIAETNMVIRHCLKAYKYFDFTLKLFGILNKCVKEDR